MKQIKVKAEAKKGGVLNKGALYAYASKYGKEAIDTLVELMHTSKQESVKMGAAGKLLDKILADLKENKHEGEISLQGVVIYTPKKNTE